MLHNPIVDIVVTLLENATDAVHKLILEEVNFWVDGQDPGATTQLHDDLKRIIARSMILETLVLDDKIVIQLEHASVAISNWREYVTQRMLVKLYTNEFMQLVRQVYPDTEEP